MQIAHRLLLWGGIATGAAALLHVAIVLGGPEWYRFFGAGEDMARLASRGSVYPTFVTLGIAAVLAVWSLYALSGSGIIGRLPFLRTVLLLVAAAYLLRGFVGVPAVLWVESPYMRELRGRMAFMIVSSLVCLVLGVCYAVGAAAARPRPLRSGA